MNFDVSHHFYTHVFDFMTSFSLSQVVTSPTHFSHCGHHSLIDLVFVSNLSYYSTCSIIPQLADSDHLGYHGAMYSPSHTSMQEKLALAEQRNHPVDQEEESIF